MDATETETSTFIEEQDHETQDDLEIPFSSEAKVVYSGQDFDVYGVVRRLQKGDILVPQFSSNDENIETEGFQRNFVWTKLQQERFIESILFGYPIPNIFLVLQEDKRLLVLDGQQRLTTLKRFCDEPGFALSSHVSEQYQGKRYDTLDEADRRRLDNTFMRAVILTTQPNPVDRRAIYQIFERLNSGGTQLSVHEIRIAVYAGEAITYISTLNRNSNWRNLYGRKEDLRFRDHELITRILALFADWENYTKPLRGFLNDFLGKHMSDNLTELHTYGEYFLRACRDLLQAEASEQLKRGGKISPPVADAVFTALMAAYSEDRNLTPSDIHEWMLQLASDKTFLTATEGGTTDDRSVKDRIGRAIELLNKYNHAN